jgi:hypothetical protein
MNPTKRPAGATTRRARLDAIYSAHFDDAVIAQLKGNRLPLDDSRVVRAKELRGDLLERLFARQICILHVPGFCDPALARRAGRWIAKNVRPVSWYIPDARGRMKTDMSYAIGVPKPVAARSPEASRRYSAHATKWLRTLRAAFAPALSPMDKLRLELEEVWQGGAGIERFLGKNGFAGIVRVMKPEALLDGIAGRHGACHVDAPVGGTTFSANIYLDVPKDGGELRMWRVPMTEATARNPTHALINGYGTFTADMQEVIHDLLPKPVVVKPRPGDLVILDASRPHAVAGFSTGTRVSIQTFLRFSGAGQRIELSS